jgi:SMC interacting uncharacterized protein involved in chromosome segregation
MDREKLIQD